MQLDLDFLASLIIFLSKLLLLKRVYLSSNYQNFALGLLFIINYVLSFLVFYNGFFYYKKAIIKVDISINKKFKLYLTYYLILLLI